MDNFSIEDAIQIQKGNLEFWKGILKEEVYNDLEKWAVMYNAEAETGYDIRRGDKLKYYVLGYKI